MTEQSQPNDVMGHIDRDWHHTPDSAPCTDANRIAGARILIAGDHGELRTDVAAYLARQNLSVVDPPNRRQAIVRQIQEIAPGLVLLRHAPQHADGLAPLRDIRVRSDVPVIMITAVDTDDTDRILHLRVRCHRAETMGVGYYAAISGQPGGCLHYARNVTRLFIRKGRVP